MVGVLGGKASKIAQPQTTAAEQPSLEQPTSRLPFCGWVGGGMVHYLFMTNFTSAMLSRRKSFEVMSWALTSLRRESSDSPSLPIADSKGFKLALEPVWPLVNLGHVHHRDGHVVLGAGDAVAGGAFPPHVQVHKLTSVLLRVAPAAATARPQKGLDLFNEVIE